MAKARKKSKKKIAGKIPEDNLSSAQASGELSAESQKSQPDETNRAPKFKAPPPFNFKITIASNNSIDIKSVNVDGVIATEENFTVKEGNIICEIAASIATFTFLLIIEAEGSPDATTTFNLTCDDKKVFDEDQEIVISSTGRGGFVNKKTPLP